MLFNKLRLVKGAKQQETLKENEGDTVHYTVKL